MQRVVPQPPQGALRQADGSVLWRVWAPLHETIALVTFPGAIRQEAEMAPDGSGYFVHRCPRAEEGLTYAYRLPDGHDYPDPASRWQPNGVHHPSALFFPDSYRWSDQGWRGVARDDLVIYELHIGTFTPEGNLPAIIPRLPQLASLGITAIELMPVAQFPGHRNWGYDGVHPCAVQNTYGGPRALQQLVDAAHQAGLAVILDVVYNHIGPEGAYFEKYGPYFTDHYHTPWGRAINYDGPYSDPVRQFVVDNACMWVRDFHIDGLRLDAVHAIYDFSPYHILAEIQDAVQAEAAREGQQVYVIAESSQNDVRIVLPQERGGYGLDGVCSDDFHHSIHALLTGERDGYYMDFGRPAQLAKALSEVFVYDGCYSAFRRRRQGTCVCDVDRGRFIVCLQNHDQVGNRARGDRLAAILPSEAQRLACGLLLLSPCVPLLFMGEEYGERSPFPFFSSFGDPVLVEAVRRGRYEEFAAMAFQWKIEIPDPQGDETFAAAKIHWEWSEDPQHANRRQLYQDLLAARRQWPPLRDRRHTEARILEVERKSRSKRRADQPPNQPLLILSRGGDEGIIAVANLGATSAAVPAEQVDGRKLLLSTEDQRYGGNRKDADWYDHLLPYELLIFGTGG